jgi:hypothetical protein
MLQEQFLKAADSSVDPSSRAMEEMLAAFERRIDKKIRVRICSKKNVHFVVIVNILLAEHERCFVSTF